MTTFVRGRTVKTAEAVVTVDAGLRDRYPPLPACGGDPRRPPEHARRGRCGGLPGAGRRSAATADRPASGHHRRYRRGHADPHPRQAARPAHANPPNPGAKHEQPLRPPTDDPLYALPTPRARITLPACCSTLATSPTSRPTTATALPRAGLRQRRRRTAPRPRPLIPIPPARRASSVAVRWPACGCGRSPRRAGGGGDPHRAGPRSRPPRPPGGGAARGMPAFSSAGSTANWRPTAAMAAPRRARRSGPLRQRPPGCRRSALPARAVIADVFVRFVTCRQALTPAFASGPFDALDAVQTSRLRDAFEVHLVLRGDGLDDDFDGLPQQDRDLRAVARRAPRCAAGTRCSTVGRTTSATAAWRASCRRRRAPARARPDRGILARVFLPVAAGNRRRAAATPSWTTAGGACCRTWECSPARSERADEQQAERRIDVPHGG